MGAWYNWTMVTFESDDSDMSNHDDVDEDIDNYFNDNEYLSKIFCFFRVMGDCETYAVVHSCGNRDKDQDSILFQRWNKEMVQCEDIHHGHVQQCHEPVGNSTSTKSTRGRTRPLRKVSFNQSGPTMIRPDLNNFSA